MTNHTTPQADACPDCPEWRADMCWMCKQIPVTSPPTPVPPEPSPVPTVGPTQPPTGKEPPPFLAEFLAEESPLGDPLSPDAISRLRTLLEDNGLDSLAAELEQRRPFLEERYLMHQAVVTIASDIQRFEELNLQQAAAFSRAQLKSLQHVDQLQINKINLSAEQLAGNSINQ